MVKFSPLAGVIAAIVIVTSASAVGLTAADFDYLTTQNVQKDAPLIRGLSPKEQSWLHVLINDLKTANDPIARAKYVSETLAEFKGHQDWEREHPGQLWDVPSRQVPK